MRKTIIALTAILLFAPAAARGATYTVTHNVYERTGPSTSYEIVTMHNVGDSLSVKEIVDGWAKLSNGHYVYAQNVAKQDNMVVKALNTYRTICVFKANIRTEPSTHSAVHETLSFGTRLKIIGETGEWYKTKSGFYIHKSCVTDDIEAYCLEQNKDAIFVSKQAQTVKQYANGELVCDAKCVTGADATPTPSGVYKIYRVGRNETMGEQNVQIALYFNNGIAIHDASWRSSFGGAGYAANGSHGCVNVAFTTVEQLARKAQTGTTVIVYD